MLPRPPRDDELDEGAGLVAVPGFLHGGRVERSGIALVHEGEYILPAPGSEAAISPGSELSGGQVINYYFPIEVEVIGALDEAQLLRVAAYVFDELAAALDSRA